ncbi:MAG: HIRAN domain-containing protein [Dehalococcoidia bacterium]
MSLFGWLRRSPATALGLRRATSVQMRARTLHGAESLGRQYGVAVVGESHYADSLWQVVGAPPTWDEDTASDAVEFECTAILVRDPDNQFDRNAVRVYVGGLQVGHLSREDALRYRAPLDRLSRSGFAGACDAIIRGGFSLNDGSRANLGVWLDLAEPDRVL